MADQAANNGGGQGAGKKFVSFSRSAAQRIANAVRIVEGGDRNQPPLIFDHPQPSTGKIFRICTFTGSWTTNTAKTVTFRNITSTPNTQVAHNVFVTISVSSNYTASMNCAIAKDGTAWYLISAEC